MDKLNELILKYARMSGDVELNDNTDLIDDLGYDSISLIQLIIEIEEIFNIEINDYKNTNKYSMLKRYITDNN